MKTLLLGSEGQVGWELRRMAPPGTQLVVPPRAEADLGDPDSLRALLRREQPALVLNAAAHTAVDAAESDEPRALALNAVAPGVIAEGCRALGALLVHYSTDYVFDGRGTRPYREDDPVAPQSAYGRSKLAGELAIRAAGARHLILRTSWVYAPRGRNFVLTMLRLASEKPELRVVADQVGCPTAASSLARATWSAVHAVGGAAVASTYHATGAGATSWHGFAERVVAGGARRGLCKAVPVRPISTSDFPTPAKRPAYSVLDNARLAGELGVRLPPWTEALDDCLDERARAATGKVTA